MPEENTPPPARIPRLGWVIVFLVATTVIAWSFSEFQKIKRPVSSRLDRHAETPEFELTSQYGQPVTKQDLKGKIWVANFIFTKCAGPCPLMTNRMASLNQSLGKVSKDVELVTITVDPENDTPEVLKKYGELMGATPERWKFLTGLAPEIDRVVQKGFLQSLTKDQDGSPVHSTRFVLVDRDGWMRSFQDGNDPEVVQKLLMDIGDLLRESPSATKTP